MSGQPAASFDVGAVTGAVVVTAGGEIDAVTAPAFRQALDSAVHTGAGLVLIDLAEVSFLDSAGLAVVVGARRHLPVGQRLALANVPARMVRMLQVAAVEAIVEVHAAGQPWPWPGVGPPGRIDPRPPPG